MNQRTNSGGWFYQSDITKNKTPQSSVREICDKSENQRTMRSKGFEQWLRANGERRRRERKRYLNHYGGTTGRTGARGGESNVR